MIEGKKILIVEDSFTIRYEVRIIIEQARMKLVEAANEIGLFMKIEEYGKMVDLIIMDLTLEYENGFDLIEKIKKVDKYRNIPILILTEHADKDTVLKARRFDIAGYLRKPIQKDELIKRIKNILDTEDSPE